MSLPRRLHVSCSVAVPAQRGPRANVAPAIALAIADQHQPDFPTTPASKVGHDNGEGRPATTADVPGNERSIKYVCRAWHLAYRALH